MILLLFMLIQTVLACETATCAINYVQAVGPIKTGRLLRTVIPMAQASVLERGVSVRS
jgi:hypothetical protein